MARTSGYDPSHLSVSEAARALGVSGETVRNQLKRGEIKGNQSPTGRWVVDKQSVDALLAKTGRRSLDPAKELALLAAKVDELHTRISELKAREVQVRAEIHAVSRERDFYRSEAAAFRDVVAQMNAAVQEAGAAFRDGVSKLEDGKSRALSVLTAPASPEELLR